MNILPFKNSSSWQHVFEFHGIDYICHDGDRENSGTALQFSVILKTHLLSCANFTKTNLARSGKQQLSTALKLRDRQ